MDSPTLNDSPTHEPSLTKPKSKFLLEQNREAIRQALDHLVVFEKYQNGKNESVEKSGGVCKACQTSTTHKCQTCNDHYCSNDCQHPYWKKHKAKCNKLSSSELKSHTSSKDTEADEKLMKNYSSSPFAKFTQHINNTPMSGTTSKVSTYKSGPVMGRSIQHRFKNYEEHEYYKQKRLSLGENESKFKGHSRQTKRSLGKNSHNNTFPLGTSSSAETESVSNSLSSKFSKPEAKTKDLDTRTNGEKFESINAKRVVFFYKEPDKSIHWVMNESDVKVFELIHKTLNKECDNYETTEPEVGLVCGCKYFDEWYRAKVINLDPCRVHYIDYGNVADAPSTSLKNLPPEIKMVKNLIYSIRFDNKVPEEYKDKDLSGKTLKVETKRITSSGVEIVRILSDCSKLESTDSEATENETNGIPATKIRLVMSLIKSDSKGMISFLPGDSNIRFGLMIPDGSENETGIDVKESKALDLTELNAVKAAEGDYVLVIDYNDQRRRGKVLSMLCSTYYVLLIDYGIVIVVNDVYRLPGRKAALVHLGAMVTINEIVSPEKVKNMGMSVCHVTGEQGLKGRWPCELKETFSEEVIATGYIQSPPEEGVTVPLSMPIKTGSICEMSIVTGVRTCYIRPLDEQVARKNLEMSVKMAEFLVRARPLTQPPEIGKMYAAKNKKDDCFHRAVIKSKNNDKFKVLFVDHGTVEEVEMKDLKPLPVRIKVVPFFAVEVTLTGITVKSLSDLAKEYLDKLISKNLTLVLSFSENENDEVVLKVKKSNVLVNALIENPENLTNDIEMSDEEDEKDDETFRDVDDVEDEGHPKVLNLKNWLRWVKSPDDGVIMKRELKLPNICVKKKYDLVLHHIDESEFFSSLIFWMSNTDDETFTEINYMVNRHCSKIREPYRPKNQEMCLGLYEGAWYRAYVLNSVEDEYRVFFVDFGNTCKLKPKEIRKMEQELMKHPAWAFKCAISCVGKLIGKANLKAAVWKVLSSRINTVLKDVLVVKHEFETYYLNIPEVEEVLPK